MSSLSIAPDLVATASGNLQNLGSALRSANAAAAAQTTAIAAPAADEVSAAITAIFGANAQEFQALSAEAAAFHDEFVNLLSGGAVQYVATEIANAQHTLVNAVNAPAQAFLGHPLIGTAANLADTTGSELGFGPFSISTIQTITPQPDGVITSGFASVSLSTPFGLVPLAQFTSTGGLSNSGINTETQTLTTFSPLLYGQSYYLAAEPIGGPGAAHVIVFTVDIDGLVFNAAPLFSLLG